MDIRGDILFRSERFVRLLGTTGSPFSPFPPLPDCQPSVIFPISSQDKFQIPRSYFWEQSFISRDVIKMIDSREKEVYICTEPKARHTQSIPRLSDASQIPSIKNRFDGLSEAPIRDSPLKCLKWYAIPGNLSETESNTRPSGSSTTAVNK